MMKRGLFSGEEVEEVLVVREVEGKTEMGAYAPLTGLNNYFVLGGSGGNGGKVLVHAYAHITNPQKYEMAFGAVMKLSDLFVGGYEEGN